MGRNARECDEDNGIRLLYRLGMPLPKSQVWIGHDPNHNGDGSIAHGRQPLGLSLPGIEVEAVRIILQFNQMILMTVIDYGDSLRGQAVSVEEPRHFEQVWPPRERFEWPSPEALKPRGTPEQSD